MWKALAAVVNRFVATAYDEASTEKSAGAHAAPVGASAPATGAANAPSAVNREFLEQQFQRSLQLMQSGNAPAAQHMIRAAVARIAQQQPMSALFGEACIKEATILIAVNELAKAEAACRAAMDLPAPDEASRKERVTYKTFLGDILARQKKLDDAETMLREALGERRDIFGPEHTGYAIGLSALADVLLQADRAGQALESIDEAVRLLGRAKHERLPTDLALRAFIVKSAEGMGAEAFAAWTTLTRGMQKTLVHQCVWQSKQADARLAQAVLGEVRERAQGTAGFDAPILLTIDIALASTAKQSGDHAARIAACRSMVALCETMPDRHQLAAARQALAMALDDGGATDEVVPAYEASVRTAREVNDLSLLSTVLMNYAMSADRAGRPEQAEALHREAVDHGASSGDWSTHGHSTVAYGIFLQHNGRLEEARGLLEEAVAHLSPAHVMFAAAQEHLAALDRGVTCACEKKG